jgi:hypothetical protein
VDWFTACVLIVCALSPISVFSQNPVCDFSYKKTITLQGSQVVGGPHTDFPVLISHTDPDLASGAGKVTSASGFDIIFADDTGNALDFQLEKYDGSTGQYVAWVRIPSINNGTDVDIHMLYGKSTITTDQSTTDVWVSNYHAVWHLNDDFLDQTSTSYDGTNNGSTDVTAKIADGQNFVDPNHWIETPTFPNLSADFTISGWVFTTDNTRAGQRVFADDATNTGGYALSVGDPGTGRIRFYARGTGPVSLDSPGGVISNSTWHYCVAVTDITNSIKRLYVDGVQVASGGFSGTWGTDAGNASIGGEVASGESGNRFQGNLDEIRVASSALSANWIATEYNSQNQPILVFGASNAGDFYSVAAEEDVFHTSASNGDWDLTSVWDSGLVPDGIFENVVITNNDVDIDGGSGDYDVCNCTLNGDGSTNTRLDINSSRVLTVAGNLDANHTGSGGSNNTRLLVTADATVNVAGSMIWDSPNSITDSDLQLLLRTNGVINLTQDLDVTKSNGDDVLIDLEDDSQLNITGDFLITHTGGDNMTINIDDAASIDVGGNIIMDQSGGDDITIRLNNNAGADGTLTVAGDVNIDLDGGDDIEFLLDDANSMMNITGDITAICNGVNDSQFLDFNIDDGTLNANDVSLTRAMDMGPVEFDIESGSVTVNSMTVISSGTLFNDGLFGIDIDGDGIFTNNNDFDVTMSGGDDFRIRINVNNGTTAQLINNGNFTINRSDGDDIDIHLNNDDSFFYVGQNFNITSTGGEEFDINLDNDASIDIDGDLNIALSSSQDAQIDLEAAVDPTFNVDGNASFTSSGGVNELLFDLNGGTFQVDQNLTFNNSGSGTTEDIDIELDEDAMLNVGGDLSVNLTGGDDIEFDLGNNVGGSTGQAVVSGDATFTQNRSGSDHVIRLLIFEDTRFEVQGELTWTNSIANTSLMLMNAADNGQITVMNDINLNAQSDGDIEIRLENTSELQIGGDFVRQSSPNNYGLLSSDATATVEYNGTAAQLFAEDAGAGTDGFNYGIVEINNSGAAAPQITMEGLATVNGGVVFIDGVVASTLANILVIENGASTSGASDASHVDGFVRKIGNTPAGEFTGDGYAFPVGDDGNYQPIYITAPAGTDQFDAQYLEANPHPTYDNTMKDASIDHISGVEHWLLETPGTPSVSVRLSWDGNSGGVSNLADLVVARWNGSSWIDEGNGGTTGNTSMGTVVSLGTISSFSPFTLGTTSSLNALPIELLSFNASYIQSEVVLDWVTASETDNDFFTIERSIDAQEWESIENIPGAGSSVNRIDYQTSDPNPHTGLSFYRLKQTDFDGSFSYSPIERVFVEDRDEILIRPVPSTNQVALVAGTEVLPSQVVVYNANGQRTYPNIVNTSSRELELDFTGMARGVYQIKIQTTLGVSHHRVILID